MSDCWRPACWNFVLPDMRRLRVLSHSEQSTLARAAVLLPLVCSSLHLVGYRRTYQWLEALPCSNRVRGQADEVEKVTHIGNMLALAARRHPLVRPTCLPRSLVLRHLLRREGYPATLHFGARKVDGRLLGHAWVALDGEVVGDASDVAEQYVSFETLAPGFGGRP